MANVRSLRPGPSNHKCDEVQANVRFLTEYRDACVMCFTETWLDETIPGNYLNIDGFGEPFRLDRDRNITGKSTGGGVCIYVNEQWCAHSNVKLRQQVCTPHVEVLSVSLRPKYLPREFGLVFITVLYVHPAANETRATTTIADCEHTLELISPEAPCFVLGDFNKCSLRSALPSYQQYVSSTTRAGKILDCCYGNVKNAYRSISKQPIGSSDHNTVHLITVYRKKVKTGKVSVREVKQWTTDAVEELRGCMECTDWDVFFSPGDSLDHTATVISDYIAFCEDMIIPKKLVKSFPNSKPWITKELKKKTVSQKRDAYLKKDSEEGKRIQTELKRHIRDAKAEYKDNIELQFKGGNMRDAWRGLKTLAGQTQPQAKDSVSSLSEQTDRAVKCNDFYYRFDRFDFTTKLSQVLDRVRQNIYTYVNDTEVEEITPKVVHRELNNTWIKLDLLSESYL